MTSIDQAHRLLKQLGWSVGDLAYHRPDGSLVWQVTGRRDEQTIVGRAGTEVAAWNGALRQAGIVQRGHGTEARPT